MAFLRKPHSLVAVWIKSLATAARCSFCSGSRSHGMNFATTCFMPRSCIKNLRPGSFWIPRSAASSHTVSHDICWLQPIHIQLLRCSAHCRPSRTWIIFNYSWPSLKDLCHIFICAALIASSPKAFWIIWTVSVKECSSLTQNLMQICCSTHSVILNAMATQCTCSLSGVYWPHWLVQWSHRCSHMCIPVHSPWLPGYIDVM